MSSQRRRFILTSAVSLALAGTLLSPAPVFAGKGKGKGRAKIEKLCEQISCSEDQARQITQVFEQLHIDVKPEREAIRELREQLATQWKRDRPDEAELAKLADKIGAHERNIADRRMDAMLELHALLSAEQRAKVAERLLKLGKK